LLSVHAIWDHGDPRIRHAMTLHQQGANTPGYRDDPLSARDLLRFEARHAATEQLAAW
jgi:hypothetical protein